MLLVVLGGCSAWFGLDEPTRTSDANVVDARIVDVGIDSPALSSCPPPTMMSPLLACYDFEGEVRDATGNLAVNASNTMFVPGLLGMALRLRPSTSILIPDTPLLDTSAVTMQLWLRVTQFPVAGARMGLWDTDTQYGMFLGENGNLMCQNATQTGAGHIALDVWTHVACTIDSTGTRIYVNGVAVVASTQGLFAGSMNGAALGADAPMGGDKLLGDVDLVRIYRVARTQAEICGDALACK
jgi:hypothetical protein